MPYPEAIAHYPKSAQYLIKMWYNRIFKQNKNNLSVIVGQTGSGKSYAGLSLLCGKYLYRDGKLPPDEVIIEHVIFRMLDFIRRMNNLKDIMRGEPWEFDEAGIDAGNQDYATLKNKVISWYAQTCRNQHQDVTFTLPTLGMLTPQVRKLLHFYLEMAFIDRENSLGVIKPLVMQYNTRADKIYYHYPRIFDKDGSFTVIELAGLPLPHKSLLDLYEKKKSAFTQDLNKEIAAILENIDAKKQRDLAPQNSGLKPLSNKQSEVYEALQTTNDVKEVARILNTSESSIYVAIKAIRKKGYQVATKNFKYNAGASSVPTGALEPAGQV